MLGANYWTLHGVQQPGTLHRLFLPQATGFCYYPVISTRPLSPSWSMARCAHAFSWVKSALFWAAFASVEGIAAKNAAFLDQGFFFNYNKQSEPVPIPVTTQCETIHLNWQRGQASGPNPTAPYFLEIFTSAFIVPFTVPAGGPSDLSFDWQVPFAPGTLYQICMFDSNGVTGGCQGIYTVIANTTGTPSCANVTFPAGAMDVAATVSTGSFSQYGWVDQCTDLSVSPKNGTGPYTMTIAPALHPPVNITSDSTMTWTVDLSWASPFFVAVHDSAGNSWANGPLHSGGGGPTGCLDLDGSSTHISVAGIIGASIGSFVFGTALALLCAFFYIRHHNKSGYGEVPRRRRKDSAHSIDIQRASNYSASSTTPLRHAGRGFASENSLLGRLTHGHGVQYEIEPFVMPSGSKNDPVEPVFSTPPTSAGPSHLNTPPGHTSHGESEASGSASLYTPPPGSPHSERRRQGSSSQVYVVHHDGGRAPVTVFTPDGTEVVELPPQYFEQDRRAAAGPSQMREPGPSQTRDPGPVRKQRASGEPSR
ncbi:hypothetical protein PLICRDRAFT_287211 [Plicaturopsis crispa FD-325 SS-3]|nr:hypothetical protein PLICRDRAFT_287211 [Plicaturopsis crispa FD-325 SS-3]